MPEFDIFSRTATSLWSEASTDIDNLLNGRTVNSEGEKLDFDGMKELGPYLQEFAMKCLTLTSVNDQISFIHLHLFDKIMKQLDEDLVGLPNDSEIIRGLRDLTVEDLEKAGRWMKWITLVLGVACRIIANKPKRFDAKFCMIWSQQVMNSGPSRAHW